MPLVNAGGGFESVEAVGQFGRSFVNSLLLTVIASTLIGFAQQRKQPDKSGHGVVQSDKESPACCGKCSSAEGLGLAAAATFVIFNFFPFAFIAQGLCTATNYCSPDSTSGDFADGVKRLSHGSIRMYPPPPLHTAGLSTGATCGLACTAAVDAWAWVTSGNIAVVPQKWKVGMHAIVAGVCVGGFASGMTFIIISIGGDSVASAIVVRVVQFVLEAHVVAGGFIGLAIAEVRCRRVAREDRDSLSLGHAHSAPSRRKIAEMYLGILWRGLPFAPWVAIIFATVAFLIVSPLLRFAPESLVPIVHEGAEWLGLFGPFIVSHLLMKHRYARKWFGTSNEFHHFVEQGLTSSKAGAGAAALRRYEASRLARQGRATDSSFAIPTASAEDDDASSAALGRLV